MRSIDLIEGDGTTSLAIVEEIDTAGTIRLTASGTFSRSAVHEIVARLTGLLRETRDNLTLELPLGSDGATRS